MYATIADMQTRYRTDQLIQLTDEAGLGILDQVKLQAALDDADREIDSYVRAAGYKVPLPQPDLNLIRFACEIAFYLLHPSPMPDEVKARYDAAMAWLRRLSKREVVLTVATGEDAQPAGETILTDVSNVATARDRLRGF